MNTSIASTRSIELSLNQTELYPPLRGTAPAIVGFKTGLPAGEAVDFTLVVNGVPGVPDGIDLRPGSSSGGSLWVNPGFIASHPGNWPVQVMLQASRHGMVVDETTLWLHDTRQMQVHRMDATLIPNPANVSETDPLTVMVRATFHDRAGLELPRDEVLWGVTLPDNPPGLEVDGTFLRVPPGTAPGDVNVRIGEHGGVAETQVLTLLPALDIGLELGAYDLYPPLRSSDIAVVAFMTSLPPGADLWYSYRLNGEGGQHAGINLTQLPGTWGLAFSRDFIAQYYGPWPAEITVRALLDGQLAGQRTLLLHDTRSMVCTRVEMDLSPSDTVDVPQAGVTVVVAAPSFFDAQDIRLPHAELDWDAALENEPFQGIERHKQILLIGPEALPGTYRMTLLGPEGLDVSKFLTLR